MTLNIEKGIVSIIIILGIMTWLSILSLTFTPSTPLQTIQFSVAMISGSFLIMFVIVISMVGFFKK